MLFEKFINKNVVIFTKNNFRYCGKLISETSLFLEIDDRYSGVRLINISEIENIRGWDGQ